MSGGDGAAVRSAAERLSAERSLLAPAARSLHGTRPARSSASEIEHLRGQIPLALLAHAEWRGAALGVGADRVLVTEGSISEEDYLRGYAAATGLLFEPLDSVPRSACPVADARMLAAVAAGMLPLAADEGLALVVAPRGLAARGIQTLIARHPHRRSLFRVTSAARLHRFVTDHCGEAMGRRAAEALREAAPLLSAARSGRSGATYWCGALAALAVAASLAAPGPAWVAADVALSLLYIAWAGLRLIAMLRRAPDAPPVIPVADRHLPVYTVIAALHREAASVGGLVAALRQLDWPPEKLDVKLVLEPDDLETRAALDRIDLPPWFEIVIAPTAGPRTKPKALNAALPFARGSFTVIYDAEDRPDSQQLRAALDAFLRDGNDLACVQAALTIDNTADSWLTRMFTAEYAAHFDVLLPSLAALRLPLPLGGSSNHFRTHVLRAVGAWDPYNVTEDADLGMRLARFGYRSTVIASSTDEEAPITWRPWLQQRTRWFKGWMQTWLVHMRTPVTLARELGPAGFAIFQLMIGGGVAAALVYPAFAVLVAARLLSGETVFGLGFGALHTLAFVGGLSTCALAWAMGLARRGLLTSAWVILLSPLHWLLLSLAAWRALVQLLRDPYRWEKTDHGLALSSRRKWRRLGARIKNTSAVPWRRLRRHASR
jgi:cellulose synthase/poly-beta-1,6-N-acetylglucosamine synthase-like glycosyltransferase